MERESRNGIDDSELRKISDQYLYVAFLFGEREREREDDMIEIIPRA